MRKKRSPLRNSLSRGVRYGLIVLLGYLMHVCVMPYFKLNGVLPHMMITVLSIITVANGRLRAYWTGCVYGIITETMRPTLTFLNLFMYPVLSLIAGLLFADKSEQRLEAERSMNQYARNMNPYIRTPLCSVVCMLIYEIFNVGFIFIGGTDLTPGHISRALTGILATLLLTLVLMLPVRRILGVRRPRRASRLPQNFQ